MDNNHVNENQQVPENSKSDYQYESTGYRYSPFIYEQGFINGVLSLDGEKFKDFIHGNQYAKLVSAKLNKVRASIHQILRRIEETNTIWAVHEKKVLESKHITENLRRQIAQKEIKKSKIEGQILQLAEDRASINPYYNVSIAIIFVLAGIAFLGAEVMITHDVLFNVLEIDHWKSLPLAIAIALISIAIKPAVDRIFEEPYLSGKNRKYMHGLLIAVSLLALIALGALGYFRIIGEALFVEADSLIDPAQANNMAVEIRRQWSVVLLFTLTSMLFALAGAISFSIGLPVFNIVLKKRKLRKQIEHFQQQIKDLESNIEDCYAKIVQQNTDCDIGKKILERLPAIADMEKELEQLRTQEISLLKEYYDQRGQTDISWHGEGLQRGAKYQLTGKLLATPTDLSNHTGHHENGKNGKTVVISERRKQGKYLHEQIRNLISYNFNKTQKNYSE
jgi:hypothetical protein